MRAQQLQKPDVSRGKRMTNSNVIALCGILLSGCQLDSKPGKTDAGSDAGLVDAGQPKGGRGGHGGGAGGHLADAGSPQNPDAGRTESEPQAGSGRSMQGGADASEPIAGASGKASEPPPESNAGTGGAGGSNSGGNSGSGTAGKGGMGNGGAGAPAGGAGSSGMSSGGMGGITASGGTGGMLPSCDPSEAPQPPIVEGLTSVNPALNLKTVPVNAQEAVFADFKLHASNIDFLLDSFKLHMDATLSPLMATFYVYEGTTQITRPLPFTYNGRSNESIAVTGLSVSIPRRTTVDLTIKASVLGGAGARINVAMDNPGLHAIGSDGNKCTPIEIDHYAGGVLLEGVEITDSDGGSP